MARKVRIQRTKKPWLHASTKRNFAIGDLCTRVLNVVATYGGNVQKEAYDIARTDNRIADSALKVLRQSLVIEQIRRVELLNTQTALEIDQAGGAPESTQEFIADNYHVRDESTAPNVWRGV